MKQLPQILQNVHLTISGVYVSVISTKTGTVEAAESSANFNIKICDKKGICCQTENIGQSRKNGKIDVFAKLLLLGSCSQRVWHISGTYLSKSIAICNALVSIGLK